MWRILFFIENRFLSHVIHPDVSFLSFHSFQLYPKPPFSPRSYTKWQVWQDVGWWNKKIKFPSTYNCFKDKLKQNKPFRAKSFISKKCQVWYFTYMRAKRSIYILIFFIQQVTNTTLFKLVLDIFNLMVQGQTLHNPDTSLKHVVEYKYLFHSL